jgi:acetylornithine deacetylase/succinyl-diaminopimelate desuccinylase-like protein
VSPVRGQAPLEASSHSAEPVDVAELARELVAARSPNPPGDERAVAGVLRDALDSVGLPAARTIARDPRRPNLLVTLDFGPGGRHLVLAGHMDTKPVGDARWSTDPFAPAVDGDRLYGLGSADMKAALAAIVVAAGRLAADGPGAGRLSLLFTADEENGASFGARHVAATTPLEADGVVIGEPGGIDDDFDRLHLVSRGIARLRLLARAEQGHSSLADEHDARNAGVDAARAAVAVADALRIDTPPDAFGLEGWRPTVNTALAFRGGVGYGVLPGRMEVDTEVRLLPGMNRDALLAAFARTVRDVSARTGADLSVEFDDPPHDWLAATLVASDHPLAAAAREACTAALGRLPADSVFPGTTDATWFAELGGAPTLPALGPGLLRRAHAADEWMSLSAARSAADLYVDLARRFCAAGAGPEHGER